MLPRFAAGELNTLFFRYFRSFRPRRSRSALLERSSPKKWGVSDTVCRSPPCKMCGVLNDRQLPDADGTRQNQSKT